ncbi:hypothetical protein [Spirosoma oryzicola]|nr:hypothetical protein [Spirosoma oryzicola]UHG94374.1 hypothetical protein LQ777_27710 [Spirosoma oryzicola]
MDELISGAFAKPFVESKRWTDYWLYIQKSFRAIMGKGIDEYSQEN